MSAIRGHLGVKLRKTALLQGERNLERNTTNPPGQLVTLELLAPWASVITFYLITMG